MKTLTKDYRGKKKIGKRFQIYRRAIVPKKRVLSNENLASFPFSIFRYVCKLIQDWNYVKGRYAVSYQNFYS